MLFVRWNFLYMFSQEQLRHVATTHAYPHNMSSDAWAVYLLTPSDNPLGRNLESVAWTGRYFSVL